MKLKIRKSVSDRFRVTGSGKIFRRVSGQKHLKIHRRSSNKCRGAQHKIVSGAWHLKIKKLLGI